MDMSEAEYTADHSQGIYTVNCSVYFIMLRYTRKNTPQSLLFAVAQQMLNYKLICVQTLRRRAV